MKKIMLISMIVLSLAACKSEQEKIHEKQIEVCQQDIESGKEPTPFCLSLLPEYRTSQGQSIQQSQVSYQEQQPVAQPQVIQQAPAQNNGINDMLVGGLIGHAIGSSGNNNAPVERYSSRPAVTNHITRNVTVINKTAPTQPVQSIAPKKNYMDMSKLSPSKPVVKNGSMNISKLSSYGKRR